MRRTGTKIVSLYIFCIVITGYILMWYFYVPVRTVFAVIDNEERYDGTVNITIYEEYFCNSIIHIVDIIIDSANQATSVFACDIFGRNNTETVKNMASRYNATIAINGDYYDLNNSGYVIRNGIVYRSTPLNPYRYILCLWEDGRLTVEKEAERSAQELLELGVIDTFGFGPALLQDGEVKDEFFEHAKQHYWIKNPRTAIGMIEPLHYIIVVTDGRTDESEGLTVVELAELMKSKGAVVAYNLDGGGSTTLVYDGEVINFPSSNGEYHEREVRDAILFR